LPLSTILEISNRPFYHFLIKGRFAFFAPLDVYSLEAVYHLFLKRFGAYSWIEFLNLPTETRMELTKQEMEILEREREEAEKNNKT
jgi:hypothetical protein